MADHEIGTVQGAYREAAPGWEMLLEILDKRSRIVGRMTFGPRHAEAALKVTVVFSFC